MESAPGCARCAMPLAMPDSPCPHCSGRGRGPYERIVRLGIYDDPLRHLIHQIKYHGRWMLAEFLADRLIEQERVKALLTETDVLVPVPLYPLRQISRGYNQAELVARRLGRLCDIRIVSPMVRLKNTETQTHLHSRQQRYENLRDAFGLRSGRALRGRHLVVVDDVTTTGATLDAVSRCLADAEPASLSAVVLAIADPRRKGFEAI